MRIFYSCLGGGEEKYWWHGEVLEAENRNWLSFNDNRNSIKGTTA